MGIMFFSAGRIAFFIILLIAEANALSLWARVWSVEHKHKGTSVRPSLFTNFGSKLRTLSKEHKEKDQNKGGIEQPSGEQTGRYQFVRNAAKLVGPSVVRIDGQREATSTLASLSGKVQPGDIFSVSGSGLIMASDGYILTNAHVVENTQKVSVTLPNGRTFKATTVQCDELTDLAVLKVDAAAAKNCVLTPAPLGDSSTLHSGDWVVAVGCPVGLDFTVTSGVVSNPRRSAAEIGAFHMKGNFIQTDAALNSGNSGGPLVNDQGEVVGINSMGLTNTQAIGFAIPINRAKDIYEVLKTGKKPAHPYFGMEISSITPDVIRIRNEDPNVSHLCEDTTGSLVHRVTPGGPADRAGLRRNDIIVGVNGKTVQRAEETEDQLEKCRPGVSAEVNVVRGEAGKRVTIAVEPMDMHTVLEAKRKLSPVIVVKQ